MIIDSQMTELGYSLKSYRVRNNILQQRTGRASRKYQYNPFIGNKDMQTVNGIILLILSDMLNEPLINIIEKANRSYY